MYIITLNCISSFSYSDLTQILFRFNSNILFKFDSNVTQMYFNFAVHHHVKMHFISFHLSDLIKIWLKYLTQIWFRFNSDLFQSCLYFITLKCVYINSHFISIFIFNSFSFHLVFFIVSQKLNLEKKSYCHDVKSLIQFKT